jgi:HTH-type transcriptional regulator/antitoxin HipB
MRTDPCRSLHIRTFVRVSLFLAGESRDGGRFSTYVLKGLEKAIPTVYHELFPHVRAVGWERAMDDSGPGSVTEPATFASVVRTRRKELSLRQGDLADLAGVSERFVSMLEGGKDSVQLDKLLAVLSALGLHLEVHRGATGGLR